MENYREKIAKAKRIVVKIGTSTLTYETGRINLKKLDGIALMLTDLVNRGKEIVLVTSGAIGVGAARMLLEERPEELMERQAAAAVGQCELMNMYSTFFSKHGRTVGQMLLTKEIIRNEEMKRNALNTLELLTRKGIIPIINENDTISTDELMDVRKVGSKVSSKVSFGDNDTLSAIVAVICRADLLIILTDRDGLYDSEPDENPDAKLIPIVRSINGSIENSAGGNGSKFGTGGFITKIKAAKIVMDSGIDMVIANGDDPMVIDDILAGRDVGTLFTS